MSIPVDKQALYFFILSAFQYLLLTFRKLSVIQLYAYDTVKKHVVEYQFDECRWPKPFSSLSFAVCPHFICLNTHFIQIMLPFTKGRLAQEKIVTNFAAPTVTNSYRCPGTAEIVKENKRVKKL
jgi:hypothetical protein